MLERQYFQNRDLLLRVSPNYDPKKFDPSKYEAFIDALCENREYQKDAIRITLRYLLGGEYQNLKDLAEENYHQNPKLQIKYPSFDDFLRNLQLPERLSCSLDHATATGKSYVMYGIARIMLATGAVDQAVVLCPSNTIEAGLTEKFRLLSGDRVLKDLLPSDAEIANPRIINASNTIQRGDICIENIHATYIHTKSAIEDSLTGKGERTLVLNDEAHHMMSPSDSALKKWKEFLTDPKYEFKYIVNLSGTCYIGDDYFADVIHRFSLRDAIESKFVKSIRYVAEDSSGSEDEKFQKIHDNHTENGKRKYRRVKPITIFVTRNIAACKRLTEKLIDFISHKEKIDKATAAEKVLIVTSANEHKKNIPLLGRVDDKDNPVAWITSVSMLSEGWDVKNVLQIVPHEERAFNSKLLIAQVLGRGLRIPEAYKGEQPVVTVFNHDKWSANIKHLVDEVMEYELRLYSYPIKKKEDHNFVLYQVRYEKEIIEKKEFSKEDQFELLKKGYITYSSQDEVLPRQTEYEMALTGIRDLREYEIECKMHSIEELAHDIYNRLLSHDRDAGSAYSQEWPENKIIGMIRKSLQIINDKTGKVSEENRQKTLQAFGVIKRGKSIFPRIVPKSKAPYKISTVEMGKHSLGIGAFRRNCTVFYDDYALSAGDEHDMKQLKELADMKEDGELIDLVRIRNKYNFKTPSNVIFSSSRPERKFIQSLTKEENAKVLTAWIKSPDVGFYSIEYSWRKGEHPKRGSFNPDFFIKIENDIIVVETKMNDDITDENKAKLEYARKHFEVLNERQKEHKYYFKFLSPKSYDHFFKALRERNYAYFKAEIEAKLTE